MLVTTHIKARQARRGRKSASISHCQKLVLGEFFKDLHGDVLERAGPLHLYFYTARYSLILQWWVGRNNKDKKTQFSIC